MTERNAAPRALRLWVLICALLNAFGWVLSMLGQLNRAGYAIALGCGGLVVYLCLRQKQGDLSEASSRQPSSPEEEREKAPGVGISLKPRGGGARLGRLVRRFRRPFPFAFLMLALLVVTGGALYEPSNWDALVCRTPRVLHWLSEGRWHWVTTDMHGAFNTRTCGFEWITAPILLFCHSDRWLFLLNSFAFLLLPGLVFSVFTRVGLSRRAAWHWMWVFPAGFCFVLQAGSVANDIYGVILALAAIDFALRARAQGRSGANLRYSILAAALMTSAKFSNLALLLPWLIAILPALKRLRWQPALNFATLGLGLLASFLPTAFLNARHCGDWTGLAVEGALMRPPSRAVCFTHNAALLTVQHLAPPIFPFSSAWDRFTEAHLPEGWKATLDGFAEGGRNSYHLRELAAEEDPGLGLGLTVLVAAQLAFTVRRSSLQNLWRQWRRPGEGWKAAWAVSPYVSLGVFMCKSAMLAISRLVAPFYALLVPLLLLVSDSSRAVRTWWWRALAWMTFFLALIAVCVTPARPLFPAATVLGWLDRHHPNPLLDRARTVYSVYRQRAEAFAPILEVLPSSAKVIGLASPWTLEASLWRPLGERRVMHVRKETSLEQLRRSGVEYVVVETNSAQAVLGQPLENWMRAMNGVQVAQIPLRLLASQPPVEFAVIRVGGQAVIGDK